MIGGVTPPASGSMPLGDAVDDGLAAKHKAWRPKRTASEPLKPRGGLRWLHVARTVYVAVRLPDACPQTYPAYRAARRC